MSETMEQIHDVQIQDGGSGYFSKDSMENVPFKEDRVIRKAKRTIKRSPSKEDGVVTNAGILNNLKGPVPFSKNSRKSRNGYGRGQPKKGKYLDLDIESSSTSFSTDVHTLSSVNGFRIKVGCVVHVQELLVHSGVCPRVCKQKRWREWLDPGKLSYHNMSSFAPVVILK